MRTLAGVMHEVVVGPVLVTAHSVEASRLVSGVPELLAQQSSLWPVTHVAFDVVELAETSGHDLVGAACVYWRLFEELDVVWLWDGIGALVRSDRWQSQARSALRDDLLTTLADLTADVLAVSPPGDLDAATAVERWVALNERSVGRMRAVQAEIARSGVRDLTTLSVGLRQLRNLVLTSQSV